MKSSDQDHPSAMEEAAAWWAARLDGSNLTVAAQDELKQWLDLNPRHRELLSAYCQFSADLEEKLPALLVTGGVDLPDDRAAGSGRHWWLWLVGSSVLAAAAITLVFWFLHPATTQFESLATSVAQRQSLDLVDGSKIELDARTSLRVEIDTHIRRIKLAEGEAFFAVSQDPARPFVVETPAGSVRVKGTKFDVRAISNQAMVVTVLAGSVQISPPTPHSDTTPAILGVGDQLILSAGTRTLKRLDPAELEDVIAWREGRVVFAGVNLQDALDRFGRHHGVGITATPDAARQKIGGRYSLDDLHGFLTALEDALPVRVSYNLNGTVLVTMREPNTASGPGY